MNRQVNACWGYFGRKPLRIEKHEGLREVVVAVFPALRSGMFRRLFSTAPDLEIIITAGAATIPGNDKEFLAAIPADATEQREGALAVLHAILDYLTRTTQSIRAGDTINLAGILDAKVRMRTFLFLPVPGPIGSSALRRRLKPATDVLSLIPIAESEMHLKKAQGLESLIDHLEASEASTIFDWRRHTE